MKKFAKKIIDLPTDTILIIFCMQNYFFFEQFHVDSSCLYFPMMDTLKNTLDEVLYCVMIPNYQSGNLLVACPLFIEPSEDFGIKGN